MAMSDESAVNRIIENLQGLKGFDFQQENAKNFIHALVKGILDEIRENGEAVGTDSNGDSHDLKIQ